MSDKPSSNEGANKEEGHGHRRNAERIDSLAKRVEELCMGAEANCKTTEEMASAMQAVLTKASESQAKADNEALRANQAKLMVEEHSNAVAKLKGVIEADSAAIAAKKIELENIAHGIANLGSTCDSDVAVIAGIRKNAGESGKAVTEISGKVTAMHASLTETKNDVDAISQKVKDGTKAIESDIAKIVSAKTTADNSISEMQKIFATSSELHERTKTAHASVDVSEKKSKALLDSMESLITKAQEMEQKVAAYEHNLTKLELNYSEIKEKVEQLLPGAASGRKRGRSFLSSNRPALARRLTPALTCRGKTTPKLSNKRPSFCIIDKTGRAHAKKQKNAPAEGEELRGGLSITALMLPTNQGAGGEACLWARSGNIEIS